MILVWRTPTPSFQVQPPYVIYKNVLVGINTPLGYCLVSIYAKSHLEWCKQSTNLNIL